MSAAPRLLVAGVPGECPRRRELAELVSNHVLVHLHRQELVAVIDAERQPDELRQYRRPPRPDADDLVTPRRARRIGLVQQIPVNERTFPDGTRHLTYPCCGGG